MALLLLLAACNNEEIPLAVSATPRPTNTAVSITATATQPPATPTATPEPTPISPLVEVEAQVLSEDGRLTIARVTAPDPAWLVIHAENDGQVGEVLGYTAVPPGTTDEINITIDPIKATSHLVAMLHIDDGEVGTFEFPGPDDPWLQGGKAVAAGFDVEIQVVLPAITIADQDVLDDGLVKVVGVYTPIPGWLLIHADDDGAAGTVLGHIFLRAGLNENIAVPIQWREATPTLHAVLYEDSDRPTRLDYPDGDLPLIANGQPLITTFNVKFPPDVYVLDQPVVDGKIVVERVISDGPGWLVIYFDENELPALIIGSAPLTPGVNEQIEVEVTESAVTDVLHIMIHDDDEPIGRFNFPDGDIPRLYNGRLPASFTFQTNAGNYLIIRDQFMSSEESAVTAPLVVLHAPAWIVIRDGAVADTGDILGQTWLPPGVNRDVIIELEAEPTSETLTAVLHADLDESEQFDFPGGADQPLRLSGRVIQSPFKLLSVAE